MPENNIPIQNIYYMLSYAYLFLRHDAYKSMERENFSDAEDMLTEILIRIIKTQIKQGLRKGYKNYTDEISTIRGKIEVEETIRQQSLLRNKINCTYDDFSVDIYLNRIIKSTIYMLLRSGISNSQKKELRKLLVFFDDVQTVDPYNINWKLPFERNNQSYIALISICELIVKGLIQTQKEGQHKTACFFDEQRMCNIYERFIRNYYRKKLDGILSVGANPIEWQVVEGRDIYLPAMKTDITISRDNEFLIIDAKFYSQNMQTQYDKQTIHSGNLYQIFTYVKNKEYELRNYPHKVSGMLLYAQTADSVQPNSRYLMDNNSIAVRTLNLNATIKDIESEIDSIVNEYFSV